jgi:thiamine phosphate synthase YjbQ (UPF0047 family)
MGRLVLGDWQQLVFFTLKQSMHPRFQLEFQTSNSILGLESIQTNREFQTHDITDIIERTLKNNDEAYVTLISPDSNVMLYTLKPEFHSQLVSLLQEIAPYERNYRHHHSWAPHVGFIHIRASFISQILTARIEKGQLVLDDERLYLTELDNTPARRDIYFDVWK